MINLFSDFHLDTVNIFIGLGVVTSALSYSALEVLSRLSILLSKDGINALVEGRYTEWFNFLKVKRKIRLDTKFRDLIRAIFILFPGVFLILLNYVFVNGTLRIYLIISIILGVCFSKIIIASKICSIAIDLFFHFLVLILFVLFSPIRTIYRIMTKKRSQNYSTPPI